MKKKIAITLVITLILLVVCGTICTAFLSTKKEILLTAEEREVIDRFCEEQGIDVEARPLNEIITAPLPKDDSTLLHIAAAAGDIEVVRILVSKGEDVNVKTEFFGTTPLHRAAYLGHVEVIKFLVSKGANVNAKTRYDGFTPLHLAAISNDIETVKFLVSAGADVTAKNREGKTPSTRSNIDIAAYLVSVGAQDVNAEDGEGRTLLFWAAHQGNVQAVKLLISAGADVNTKTMNGSTPLHMAVRHNVEIVQLLVSGGADVNAKTMDGETPLDWAVRRENTAVIEYLSGLPKGESK